MKTKFNESFLLAAACIMGINQMLNGQSIYNISNSKDVAVKLSGTSTLHDWDMNAETISGSGKFNVAGNNLKSITALSISIPVENLKSKETGMDDKAYKALKSDKYKDITFKMNSAKIGVKDASKFPVKTTGKLNIAGTTKEITMDILCQVNTDKTIACTGSKKIKMTDYDVKPPEFLLGVMKTGDEITLDFNLIYKQ